MEGENMVLSSLLWTAMKQVEDALTQVVDGETTNFANIKMVMCTDWMTRRVPLNESVKLPLHGLMNLLDRRHSRRRAKAALRCDFLVKSSHSFFKQVLSVDQWKIAVQVFRDTVHLYFPNNCREPVFIALTQDVKDCESELCVNDHKIPGLILLMHLEVSSFSEFISFVWVANCDQLWLLPLHLLQYQPRMLGTSGQILMLLSCRLQRGPRSLVLVLSAL
jgi:hypothetical protein